MASLKKSAIILGVCTALAAFSGSLIGRLFLDVDEEDLYSLVPGVPTKDLFDPDLGDAFAFNLSTGRFNPTALCQLEVGALERSMDEAKYNLVNDFGESYNDVIKAANFGPESFFSKVFGTKEASKEWVLERTSWEVSPQTVFKKSCEQAVLDKVLDPNFVVYLVESFEQEGPDANQVKLVQVAEAQIRLDCGPGCSKVANAGGRTVSHGDVASPGWATRLKRNWELVRLK